MRRTYRVTTTTTAVTNRFVTSTAMKVGAYTVANSGLATTPASNTATSTTNRHIWPGDIIPNGRLTTIGITQQGGADDTMGTVVVKGITVAGGPATDTITPVAGSSATGVIPFVKWTSITGAGWVIDGGGTPTADNIIVGHAAGVIPFLGDGTLESMTIITTAAAAVTVADRDVASLFVLPNSFTVGHYELHMPFFGYLSITHAGASDIVYVFNDDPPDRPAASRFSR